MRCFVSAFEVGASNVDVAVKPPSESRGRAAPNAGARRTADWGANLKRQNLGLALEVLAELLEAEGRGEFAGLVLGDG